jgi:flagellin-specific chaperone FliS
MDQEAVTTFTRRITNGNKSQIIAVLFDMVLVDLDDATEGLKNHEQEEYMEALRHANEVLEHLQNALDFKYDISKDLYSLYDYCKRSIAKSMYSGRDEGINEAREVAMSGNVLDKSDLSKAIKNQDVVFAALTGDLGKMAKSIVEVMEKSPTKRLIFITSMGIYNEIPRSIGGGNLNENSMLRPYREAADAIEGSQLNYTLIRPGWFDEGSDNYEITRKGELFKGHDVSRQAIANLVLKLIQQNDLGVRESLGINRPQ